MENKRMNSFQEIIENVKDFISLELGDRKVFDKDVAKVLGFNQKTFATMKVRNSIPFEKLIFFCAKKRISINWLLFNQKLNKSGRVFE